MKNNSNEINNNSNKGNTLLTIFALKNDSETVEMLLKNKMDWKTKNNNNFSVIDFVAGNGLIDMLELFIKHDSQILNYKNHWGNTPLAVAIINNKPETVEYLLKNGVDWKIKNNETLSAIDEAAFKGKNNILEIFIKHDTQILNYQNHYGNTPLVVAVINNKIETVKYLLNNGADWKIKNNDNCSAIDLVACNGLIDMLELFIKHDSQILNYKNHWGDTPLAVAVTHNKPETIEYLLQKGAYIFNENTQKLSAIDLAAACGFNKSLDIFIKHNPKILNYVNNYGNTLMKTASTNNKFDTVKFLTNKLAETPSIVEYETGVSGGESGFGDDIS